MFVRFSRGSVDTCTYKTCVECIFCSSQGAGLSHAVTSTKGFTLKTRSPVQSKREENGTSLSDLACQRAYSLAQSCTFGHAHEAVHALRHLLAEAHSLPPPTHQPPHHHHPSTHPSIPHRLTPLGHLRERRRRKDWQKISSLRRRFAQSKPMRSAAEHCSR